MGRSDIAAYCIFAAAVFDFFDGFAARLLKAYSPLGIQLDSLADMVSFGVAPAAILHKALLANFASHFDGMTLLIISVVPFIVAVFSALRLAKFNIDTRQTDSFIGMPTPACALLVASLALGTSHGEGMAALVMHSGWAVIAASVILSALLVSEIPMFSLKFKKQSSAAAFIKKYTVQLVFLVLCLLSPIFFGYTCIAVMILLYIVISVVLWLVKPKKTSEAAK